MVAYPGMQNLASTGIAGFALVNGTPTILSWTSPNDGQMHRVELSFSMDVTSSETGGQLILSIPEVDGAASTHLVQAASQPAGVYGNQSPGIYATGPGQTITLSQASALTLGAAKIWAELWGS